MLSVDMERVEICTLAMYIRICTYVAQSLCKHTASSMINCMCVQHCGHHHLTIRRFAAVCGMESSL